MEEVVWKPEINSILSFWSLLSFPRKRESQRDKLQRDSIKNNNLWIPTFVGMTLDREFLHSLGSPGLVIGHAFGIYIFGSPVINWTPLVFLIPSSKFRIPNSQSNIQHQIRYNPQTPFSNHPEYSGDSPAGEGGIYLYHSTSTIENVPVTAKIPLPKRDPVPGREDILNLASSIEHPVSSIEFSG